MDDKLKQRVEMFNEGVGEIVFRGAAHVATGVGQFLLDAIMVLSMYKAVMWVFSSNESKVVGKISDEVYKSAAQAILEHIEASLKDNAKVLNSRIERGSISVKVLFNVDLNQLTRKLDDMTKTDLSEKSKVPLHKGIFSAIDRAFGDKDAEENLYLALTEHKRPMIDRAIQDAMGSKRPDFEAIIANGDISQLGADRLTTKIMFGIELDFPIIEG